MKHLKIRISGKVQGVFFRVSTLDKARELGLRGFVRNEQDGSVYVEAEAEDDVLDLFVAWCNRGPERARVEKVEIKDGTLAGYDNFEVRR